jgi:hypothetical protein
MTAFERWLHHLSNVLVGGTGLAYAVFLYLVPAADPYAVVHHPLQPLAQHLHVLFAPLLVFAVGLIWSRHVAPRLGRRGHPRRVSGLGLALSFLPMALSGYLLQIAASESWRQAWGWIHLAVSLLWTAAYVAHLVTPSAAGARGRERRTAPDPAALHRVS